MYFGLVVRFRNEVEKLNYQISFSYTAFVIEQLDLCNGMAEQLCSVQRILCYSRRFSLILTPVNLNTTIMVSELEGKNF